jgi:hypothetical protein
MAKLKTLTVLEFSKYCGVTKQAVYKAARGLRVSLDPDGNVPLTHPVNKLFKERAYQRAEEQMFTTGEVAKGWSALCFICGRKTYPATLYAPSGDDEDTVFVEEDVFFNPETGIIRVDGKEYRAKIVYDGQHPPPWFAEDGITPQEQTCRRSSSRGKH